VTATYAFLPWLRTGLAAGITRPDGDTTPAPRASVDISVVISAAGDSRPVPAQIGLYGPGDVAAIDPRAVIRTGPKAGELDAEPNELPMVEFAEPDLPWRFTPATAGGHERLRPWLVLCVLTADEITDSAPAGADGRLPAVTVATAARLPRLDQSWAWAHVQVEAFDASTETVAAIASTASARLRSRLLAPRHLLPATAYTAMVVPAFERGRLAGLREPVPDSVDGLSPAWLPEATAIRLPVYFQWSFQTGQQADFEQLARRLTARTVPASVGQYVLDARTPDPALPPAAAEPLAGTAALTAPVTADGPWSDTERAPYVAALAAMLNQPAQLLAASDAERLVAPPLWGQWHAAADRLDPTVGAQPQWFHELNADPRRRVAAGLGAEVVRRNDDELMAAAWDQVEGILAANAQLRRAQLAREASSRLLANHFAGLDQDTLLQVTSPLHGRFAASSAPPTVTPPNVAATTATTTDLTAARAAMATPTVHAAVAGSPIPPGALDGQLRRVRRVGGPVGRPAVATPASVGAQASAGASAAAAPAGAGLLDRLNTGALTARPPIPVPTGMLTLDPTTAPGRLPLGLTPDAPATDAPATDAPATAGAATLESTKPPVGAGSSAPAVAVPKPADGSWRPGTSAGSVDAPGVPVHQPVPVGGDPRKDAATAAAVERFRTAYADLLDISADVPSPSPVLVPADLGALHTTLLSKMDPRVTIVEGIRHRLTLAPWVTWTSTDPLEPIMAAPEFDTPMYEPLAELGHDWLLPGAGTISADTVTLVRSNQEFIEAYLVGLSHEMARELLFHEYPTDQRGTYFKQFWDVRGSVTSDGAPIDPETLHDITPITGWHADRPLGANTGRVPALPPDHVVLLVKSELLRRFPNTIVYAVDAVVADGERTLGDTMLFPVFSGRLNPDVSFFGFDLQPDAARGGDTGDGSGTGTGTGEGWFFVLAEHPTEPRFGLDAGTSDGTVPAVDWDDLSWEHTAATAGDLAALGYLDLNADRPDTSHIVPDAKDPALAWHADHGLGPTGANGSDLAWITLRRPFRVAIHGSDMLPKADS
jgi:hypothetical protein